MKMIATYPDYDIRTSARKAMLALPSGMDNDYSDGAFTDPASDSILAVENAGLKRENKLLRETVEILRDVVGTQLGKDLGKTESFNDTTQGKQMSLDLEFAKLSDKRLIPVSIRDACGVSQNWSVARQ